MVHPVSDFEPMKCEAPHQRVGAMRALVIIGLLSSAGQATAGAQKASPASSASSDAHTAVAAFLSQFLVKCGGDYYRVDPGFTLATDGGPVSSSRLGKLKQMRGVSIRIERDNADETARMNGVQAKIYVSVVPQYVRYRSRAWEASFDARGREIHPWKDWSDWTKNRDGLSSESEVFTAERRGSGWLYTDHLDIAQNRDPESFHRLQDFSFPNLACSDLS
ncbi:MAG: hypothetical protein JWR80_9661 [Bradyrhizobium sp.]|nr:hypothetical protein [Bradyrhizobium sp.]